LPNHRFQIALRLFLPAIEVFSLFSQNSQPVFLRIQFVDITLNEGAFFRATLQRLHILAQTRLIFFNGVHLALPCRRLGFELGDVVLLLQYSLHCFFEPGCDPVVGDQESQLLGLFILEAGEFVARVPGDVFLHQKFACLASF